MLCREQWPTCKVLIRLTVVTFSSRGQPAIKSRQPSDAAAAAELSSDKFTVRLKPSELMKLGHPLSEPLRLQANE